jgi:hypothetical protein
MIDYEYGIGQQLLATIVLAGVLTEDEMIEFLQDIKSEPVPQMASWEFYVRQVKEWKNKRNEDPTKTRGKLI